MTLWPEMKFPPLNLWLMPPVEWVYPRIFEMPADTEVRAEFGYQPLLVERPR